MSKDTVALHLSGLVRSFTQGGVVLKVLNGAELIVHAGEMVALVGPSGAGKSTLLQIAGLLEQPDAGRVEIGGQDCTGLSDDRRTALRRHHPIATSVKTEVHRFLLRRKAQLINQPLC